MESELLIIFATFVVAVAAPLACVCMLIVVLRRQKRYDFRLKEMGRKLESLLQIQGAKRDVDGPYESKSGDASTDISHKREGTQEAGKETADTRSDRKETDYAAPPERPRPQPARNPSPSTPGEQPAATSERGLDTEVNASGRKSAAGENKIGKFDQSARDILKKVRNWLIVGEEHRSADVSVEFAVASNWLLRLGIVIVVIGIGFFLKYAVDTGMLPPRARVSLSILAGIAMIGAGVRLLKGKYNLFGQGLVGGGLAVLYFSIFAAFHFYGFVPQYGAFVLMAIVTISAGFLAVRCDSLLIALLGLAGGYATPIMLSTGMVDFIGLYTYLLFLGCGVFVTARYKNWHLLNTISLLCTYALAIASIVSFYEVDLFWQVFPFFVGFFILFSTMTFIHNLLQNKESNLIEVIGLFVNAGVFFAVGYLLIRDTYGAHWAASLTVLLALFYVAHLYYMLPRRHQDRGLTLSFLALGAFFVGITVPLLLSSTWITVSWAVQAVVLLWIAGKLRSRFLQQVAYVFYLLVLGRLFLYDMDVHYFASKVSADMALGTYVINLVNRLVGIGVPIASFFVGGKVINNEMAPAEAAIDECRDTPNWLPNRWGTSSLWVFACIVGFLFLQFEVNRSLGYMFEPLRQPMLTLVWVGAGVLLFKAFLSTWKELLKWLFWFVFGAAVIKLFFVDLVYWELSINAFRFSGEYSFLAGIMRLIDFGFVIALGMYVFHHLQGKENTQWKERVSMGYISLTLLLVVLTLEINTFMGAFVPGLRSGGITILWSMFALGLLIGGILKRVPSLRYVGLVLFAVVIGKIFFVDLEQLEPIFRIIAFIVLGVLTLCGSFVYLRFRYAFEKGDQNNA